MKFAPIVFALMLSSAAASSASATQSKEQRELEMATKVINNSLVSDARGVTANGGEFKSSAVELALALIAARDDGASFKALLSLFAYRLDGGISEDLHCHVLDKGKHLIQEMKTLDVARAVESCRSNVKSATLYSGEHNFATIQDRVCRSEQDVSAAIKTYTQEISNSKKCDPADF